MTSGDGTSVVLLAELSWPEVAAMQQRGALVVIPTGSTEQHGWHLPLETDSRLAGEVAYAAALRICKETPIVLAPTLTIGVSGEHLDFPGTLALSATTFMAVAEEVALNLVQHGFRRLAFLNGHGGNTEPLRLVAKAVRTKHQVLVAVANYWALARDALAGIAQNPELNISHGGELETALMLHLRPGRVDMRRAREPEPGRGNPYLTGALQREPMAAYGIRRTDLTRSGSTGDPSHATAELGARFFGAAVSAAADFFRYVSTWSLLEQEPLLPPE